MGKVEKVVVLSVLLLITVILVISLSSPFDSLEEKHAPGAVEAARVLPPPGGEAEPAGSAPLAAAAGEPETIVNVDPLAAEPALAQAQAPQAPPGALQGMVTPAGPAPEPDTILVETDGLLPSFRADYRFYEWKAGDTWRSIAARYYGDPGKARLLRHENEGREQVEPGQKILVPVVDLLAGSTAGAAGPGGAVPAAARGTAGGTRSAYVVGAGDSLWRIAKREYGDGSRWKEIYDANRDVLASPDALSAGQSLCIP